jgi:L-methionine (R)-S-oxide reductase
MAPAMEATIESWLREFLAAHGGIAGTVHVRRGDDLHLCAAHHIPPPVVETVRVVPKGKGMAGLALERDRPVSTCNLETDETGDVRPGAKAVDARAAVALPVHDSGGDVRAVVGIAFAGERDIGEDELQELKLAAEALPQR